MNTASQRKIPPSPANPIPAITSSRHRRFEHTNVHGREIVLTKAAIFALGDLVDHAELARLAHVDRFGKLLAAAIVKTWAHGIPVTRASFGLAYHEGVRVPDETGSCIVGAASVGTPVRVPIFEAVSRLTGLSTHEIDGVLTGFEADTASELHALLTVPHIHHTAVMFGAAVADAMGLPPRRNDTHDYRDARHPRPFLPSVSEL